jgi:cytosine/adenosine deaminase-related metal-dependent hydrolase
MDFLLKGLTWMSGTALFSGDVRIHRSIISAIGKNLVPARKDVVISFKDHWLYPGLINGHDHLEMNLYPRLGHPPYGNYTEWGNDIYKPGHSPILEIERVDIKDRLIWGGLKNLISGATTVLHHNPRKRLLSGAGFPVKVPDIAWSHSLAFGKHIEKDFPKKKTTPYVIHAAEGTDQLASDEIRSLKELGLLRENTVIVHGIALSKDDLDLIKRAGTTIAWCPASNMFLFNETAPLAALKNAQVPIVIGSDSTMTGSATLLDEMAFALQTGLASSQEILEMVTTNGARCFRLPDPAVAIGSLADLFITPKIHAEYAQNLLQIRPKNIVAVLVDGTMRLCDAELGAEFVLKHSIALDGVKKNVFEDFGPLLKRIRAQVGDKILSQNPLWALIGA